jgi:hypothetical protein
MLLRTTETRNFRGRTGGGPSVASLTLIALAFVVVTALVITMARRSTARWERAGRAARAPRREVIAPGAALAGDAARPGTVRRRIVAAMGRTTSIRAPLRGLAETLVTSPKVVASRVRRFLRPFDILRSSLRDGALGKPRRTTRSVHDEATDEPVPLVQNRIREPLAVRPDGVPGAAHRTLFHRSPRRPRRRAREFLHRHHRVEDPHVLRADTDESPTAR